MTIILVPIGSGGASAPISTLVREVMMFLPNAPSFEVEYRIKQVLKDFCRQTRVWNQLNTVLAVTVAGQADYPADLPTGVDLVSILSAWDGDTELGTSSPGDAEYFKPGETADFPKVIAAPGNLVRLTPAPAIGGRTIVGAASFAPNELSEQVPDVILYRWRDAIREGALARLMLQVGKTWSNPRQAMLHQDEFDSYVTEASNSVGPVQSNPIRVRSW